MNFYERYARICSQLGIGPCGQKTADLFNTTRATISTWGKKGTRDSDNGRKFSWFLNVISVDTRL